MLKKHITPTELTDQTLENPSDATVNEEIDYSFTKKNSYDVTFSETSEKIWKGYFETSVKMDFGFKIFGIGATCDVTVKGGFEKTTSTSTTNGRTVSHATEETISIKKSVTLPPHTSVKVTSYLEKLENLEMPFKAKLTVYGDGPLYENNGKLSSGAIRSLLQRTDADADLMEISSTDTTVSFRYEGTMVASIGLKSYEKVENIKNSSDVYFINFPTYDVTPKPMKMNAHRPLN